VERLATAVYRVKFDLEGVRRLHVRYESA